MIGSRLGRRLLSLLVPLLWVACRAAPADAVAHPIEYAEPRMGSGGYGYGYGSAFPGASMPNGMMRVGPDTSGTYAAIPFLHFSGYWAGDDTIRAFSHLHLHGAGGTDYGALGILPAVAFDPTKLRVERYASTFDKSSERAVPGSYAVTLDSGPIRVELAAGVHSAHERFTFPPTSRSGAIIIDLAHALTQVASGSAALDAAQRTISGQLQTSGGMSGGYRLFYVIRFRQAWSAQHVWSQAQAVSDASSISGAGVGIGLEFSLPGGAPLELQIGLSLVSAAGAQANLDAELPAFDFEGARSAAASAWDARLASLIVHGGTPAQRTLFYSALHHAFVMPGDYGDIDGSFSYGGAVGQASGYHFRTDISGWDTYRSLAPLYTLLAPDLALDCVQSLAAMAKLTGDFPKWPLATDDAGAMLGSPADVMISEAYAKGLQAFDAHAVYQRLRDAALEATLPAGEGRGGRDDFADYSQLGYIPFGHGSSVSLTCELNQDDFALSNFAAALGEAADSQALLARSAGYRKLFDAPTGFLRAHAADGQLADSAFQADTFGLSGEYDEADAYQTEFCPQHDPAGLAALWGGSDKLVAALSDLFTRSKAEHEAALAAAQSAGSSTDPNLLSLNLPPTYYFAGNEPDIHYVYLFARLGRPDLTQQWLPWVMGSYFSSAPTGLPGNDDGGTMSAWLVFSQLGFYPIPGSDQYVIGTPLFPQVDISVSAGGTQAPSGKFSVIANGVSSTNIYIQSAQLNGHPLDTPLLHHADLVPGGSLVLTMGPKPSAWGQVR